MRRRGYTLVELLVSTLLVGVLSALAVGALIAVERAASETRFLAEADQEIKGLSDWLAASIRGVGGGAVQPWMAVYAENAVSGGSDRLTWAHLDDQTGPCRVMAQDEELVWRLGPGAADGSCCVDQEAAGRQALVVSIDGAAWRSLRIAKVDPDLCQVAFHPLGAKVEGSTVPASGLLADNDRVGSDADFLQGSLHVVEIRRLSLDGSDTELILEEDRNPLDGSFESSTMMDRVYDLQVGLGYDCDPRDGTVSDSASGSDEWLGNATGDALGSGGLSDAEGQDLRLVQLGFTHGSPTDMDHSNPVQLLDGPIHFQAGAVLQPHRLRVSLRNRTFFQ